MNPNATGDKEKMLPCRQTAKTQLVTKYKGGGQAARAGLFPKCQLVDFLRVGSLFLFIGGPKGSQQLSWSEELIKNKSIVLSWRFLSYSLRADGKIFFLVKCCQPFCFFPIGQRQKWQIKLLLWASYPLACFQTSMIGEMKGGSRTRSNLWGCLLPVLMLGALKG